MQKHHTTLEWSFPEYEIPHRSTSWYVIAGLVVGLLVVWSVSQQNFTFPLLIIMVTIILFAHSLQTPVQIKCILSPEGISLGKQRYPFTDIESFWIIETEVGHVLYVQTQRGMKHVVKIPLHTHREHEVREVRDFLCDYLEESNEYVNEPLGDWLTRRLRL
ncbi:MAG: hypothetical protein Q8P11_00260 [bacterium]|nr:hypothetical protein [bacterium]